MWIVIVVVDVVDDEEGEDELGCGDAVIRDFLVYGVELALNCAVRVDEGIVKVVHFGEVEYVLSDAFGMNVLDAEGREGDGIEVAVENDEELEDCAAEDDEGVWLELAANPPIDASTFIAEGTGAEEAVGISEDNVEFEDSVTDNNDTDG